MSAWDGRSRGTALGYKFFVFTIRHLGLRFSYLILNGVVLYYYLFEGKAKKTLFEFYHRYMNIPKRKARRLIRRNFTFLGRSIADKMAFLMESHEFDYEFRGHGYLINLADRREGAVLISAHIGNWDVAGNMLIRTGLNVPVNVVAFPGEAEKIREVMENLEGGNMFNVIEISDDLSHVIRVRAALRDGQFVCIHGDRFVQGARTLSGNFLGHPMSVPAGPFEIAARFKVETAFVWNIKEKPNTYILTAEKPHLYNSAQEAAQAFLDCLEVQVRKFPEHWFNYHNVFEA